MTDYIWIEYELKPELKSLVDDIIPEIDSWSMEFTIVDGVILSVTVEDIDEYFHEFTGHILLNLIAIMRPEIDYQLSLPKLGEFKVDYII